jgi:hypothetical protein
VRRKVMKIPEGRVKPVEYDFTPQKQVRCSSVMESMPLTMRESMVSQNKSTFVNRVLTRQASNTKIIDLKTHLKEHVEMTQQFQTDRTTAMNDKS